MCCAKCYEISLFAIEKFLVVISVVLGLFSFLRFVEFTQFQVDIEIFHCENTNSTYSVPKDYFTLAVVVFIINLILISAVFLYELISGIAGFINNDKWNRSSGCCACCMPCFEFFITTSYVLVTLIFLSKG